MTGRDWLRQAAARLAATGNPDARVDARWMLEASGASPEAEVGAGQIEALEGWIERRLNGAPTQYILSEAHFYGIKLYVDERVLIPRQDTETLCEEALNRMPPGAARVLDLCTGSGALAVAIKKLRPEAKVSAADVSQDALDVARRNARSYGLNIEFIHSDLLERVQHRAFDLIACNPPYLSDADMDRLQAEVRREPELALRGGPDGLDFYRRIAGAAPACLAKGGAILLEVGIGQARAVADLFAGETQIICDINAIERVVIWKKKG